jgi:hypothetical protein
VFACKVDAVGSFFDELVCGASGGKDCFLLSVDAWFAVCDMTSFAFDECLLGDDLLQVICWWSEGRR